VDPAKYSVSKTTMNICEEIVESDSFVREYLIVLRNIFVYTSSFLFISLITAINVLLFKFKFKKHLLY